MIASLRTALAAAVFLACASAQAVTLIGLNSQNQLSRIDTANVAGAMNVDITGLAAGDRLVGIDTRPKDGKIYGVSLSNQLYTVNEMTGVASFVAALSAPVVQANLGYGIDFNPVADFVPVSSMGYFDFIFVTQSGSSYPTLADFIEAAKAKPGALNVGTINVGSTQNLAAQLFKSTAGVDVTIVPFRSSPDVLIALLRGDIQMAIENYTAVQSHVADKAAIAVSSSGTVRTTFLPDVPTVKEAGGGDFEARSWNAIFAPKGTPPEVIATLNAALREVLEMPDLKKRALDLGIEAKASSPEEIRDRLKADIDKWAQVIERAGIAKQ